MGVRRSGIAKAARSGLGLLLLAVGMVGCAPAQPVVVRRLLAHQALLDFEGLSPATTIPAVQVLARIPLGWEMLPLQVGPLYRHQQWRSPSHANGVGVASVRLPFALSAKWIIWFAKIQYARRDGNGRDPQGALLAEWTDPCGREWFEAENDKYHVRGYAVTSGNNAWIVYSGYRRHAPFDLLEETLAYRSLETILPLPLAGPAPTAAVASAGGVRSAR